MKYEKTPCANSDYKGAPSYGFGLIISPVLTLAPAIIGSSSPLPVVCHSLAMRLYFLLPYISSLHPSTPSHIPLFLSLPQFLPLLSILSRNISNKEIIYIRPLQLPIFPKINFSEILVINEEHFVQESVRIFSHRSRFLPISCPEVFVSGAKPISEGGESNRRKKRLL